MQHLHHVLKHIGLCVSVAVSLGFADDAVVLEQEHVAVVPPGGRPYSWRSFPHLERPLVVQHRNQTSVTFQNRRLAANSAVTRPTCLIGSPNASSVAG